MKKHLQVVIFIVSFLLISLYPTEAYISQCHPSRINSMPLKTRKLCMALSFFLENSPQRGKIALTHLIRFQGRRNQSKTGCVNYLEAKKVDAQNLNFHT